MESVSSVGLVRVVVGGMICLWVVLVAKVRCVVGVVVVLVSGIVGGSGEGTPRRFCACCGEWRGVVTPGLVLS
jgi:hypothetical protein